MSNRCLICREKILRLKQHHKKQIRTSESRTNVESCDSNKVDLINIEKESDSAKATAIDPNLVIDNNPRITNDNGIVQSAPGSFSQRLPNSASNYSINNSRLSASSSNQSFASGENNHSYIIRLKLKIFLKITG